MFDCHSLKNLLRDMKCHGYSFLTFDEKVTCVKVVYLRYDVDISPKMSKVLGQICNSIGIRANFFFQIGAETYNIFSEETLLIIKELRALGHGVGLHIDELMFENDEKKIYLTLKWFNECVTNIDFVISYHRPGESVLEKKSEYFLNAYQSNFFSPDLYVSDSRRNEEFYPKLMSLLDKGKSPIQLLLHPCWWYPEQDPVKFKNLLIRRKESELKNYLAENFNKYFGGKNEDCTFGL